MGEQQRFGLGDGYDELLRAITIRQPWASLIMAGIKPVENRTWKTTHRGVLVIHAGRNEAKAMTEHGDRLEDFPNGALIGTVRVVDCVRDSDSEWAIPGQWHWILADPRPCRPRPAKGALSLWTPEPADWAWVRRTRQSRRAAA